MWGRTWDELIAVAPEVGRSLLPFEWRRDALWALDLPIVRLPLDRVEHLFRVPLWRGEDGTPFTVRPADVLAYPERHAWHAARISEADLTLPVHFTPADGGAIVLDGLHRLAKASRLGWTEVAAKEVPRDLCAALAVVTERDA